MVVSCRINIYNHKIIFGVLTEYPSPNIDQYQLQNLIYLVKRQLIWQMQKKLISTGIIPSENHSRNWASCDLYFYWQMQNLPCLSCSRLLQEWLCMHYQEWRQENTTEILQNHHALKKTMATSVMQRVQCQHSLTL